MEKTLVVLKPGAIQRELMGEIIKRFELKGITIIGMKLLQATTEHAHKHYAVHKDKAFFPELVEYITSGPILAMVLAGPNIIEIVRLMTGKTNPLESAPGTIRGDFSLNTQKNLIHASDCVESAEYEIPIYFTKDELLDYHLLNEPSIY